MSSDGNGRHVCTVCPGQTLSLLYTQACRTDQLWQSELTHSSTAWYLQLYKSQCSTHRLSQVIFNVCCISPVAWNYSHYIHCFCEMPQSAVDLHLELSWTLHEPVNKRTSLIPCVITSPKRQKRCRHNTLKHAELSMNIHTSNQTFPSEASYALARDAVSVFILNMKSRV